MKLNWAERWAVNNPFRPLQQRMEIRWMRDQFPLKVGAVILEAGCGRGAGAAILKSYFHPAVFHAMDLDVEMIRGARKYLRPLQREGISFYVADALCLPYRSGALDAVFAFGVLHHLPDWQGALGEIARVLKPGGVFFTEELYPSLYQNPVTKRFLLHPRENRFQSQDFKKALSEAGLQLGPFVEHRKLGILGIALKR